MSEHNSILSHHFAFRNREYEAHYVAQQGGRHKHAAVEDDFREDLLAITKMLRLSEVDGLLLDKHTLLYAFDHFRKVRENFTEPWRTEVEFFLGENIFILSFIDVMSCASFLCK